MRNILFVCMGNICRSPIAEGLLQHYLATRDPAIKVHSAGINALVGQPAVTVAQQVMKEKKGIDIAPHRAKQATAKVLLEADLILVMEQGHKKEIECSLPSICGRVHRLGEWRGHDIPDPYRRSQQIFEQTLFLIEQSLHDWQTRLWK